MSDSIEFEMVKIDYILGDMAFPKESDLLLRMNVSEFIIELSGGSNYETYTIWLKNKPKLDLNFTADKDIVQLGFDKSLGQYSNIPYTYTIPIASVENTNTSPIPSIGYNRPLPFANITDPRFVNLGFTCLEKYKNGDKKPLIEYCINAYKSIK